MCKIIVLEIDFQFGGMKDSIYPVVLVDKKEIILVDCGYIGFLPKIEQALIEKGINPDLLTKLVITHHDHDHMGALYDLKKKYPQIKVVASNIESRYISGKEKSLRLEQAESMQKHLPEEQKAFGEQFITLLKQVKPVKVDCVVRDGKMKEWCGGCKIIETNGHMPGHISLYLPTFKTIIAGDAMTLENGKPAIANPQFTLDREAAIGSMNKLLGLGAERIICYHGGIYVL